MKFKAVIFDLDGTLLNTLVDLAAAVNLVLAANGFKTHPVEAYKYLVGRGMENLVRSALAAEKSDRKTILHLQRQIEAEYAKCWADTTGTYAGIPELLDGLVERNISMAVLSNKPHSFMQLIVDKFFSNWRLEAVLGARETCPKKPDPAGAKEIVSILKLREDQVLYVGDTDTDMQTAHNAGLLPVGVLWGFRTEKELRDNGAWQIAAEPAELLKFF
ncbi:N-acetylmuramic acid 6-phosphate phosphatase [subsurface metagenome]